MPAESSRQQHFMGMVHAYQMGHIHSDDLPQGVRAKVKKAARSMTMRASGEFAASVREMDDFNFPALTFKEYIVVENALVEAFSELTEDELVELTEKCAMQDEETSAAAKDTKAAVKRGGKTVRVRKDEEDEEKTEAGWEKKERGKGDTFKKTPHKEVAVSPKGKTDSVWHEDEEKAKAEKDVKSAVKRGGKEVRLQEKWAEEVKIPEDKKGMFKGRTLASLEAELAELKKTGPHKEGSAEFTKEKELNFAIRAKKDWPKHVTELWAKEFKVPPTKKGMFSGKTKAELESELSELKKTGPHKEGSAGFTKEKELNFALRAKSDWK